MNFRGVALEGTGCDGDFVFAGQVGVVAVAVEKACCLLNERLNIKKLVAVNISDGAASNVAHGIATTTRCRQPVDLQVLKDGRQIVQTNPMQLYVLAVVISP